MNIKKVNGYKISEFTLGTVQLGMPYGVNNSHGMPTYDESARILQTALDCGVCSFDTAAAYGTSEEVLGKFFGDSNAEKTIITKVKFSDTIEKNIEKVLFEQVQASVKALKLNKLPFLMLHRDEYIDVYGKPLIDALNNLKSEGLVDNIGVSFNDKSKIERLMDTGIFNHIQIAQNIFDNNEIKSGRVENLQKNGISVFVRSVYLQGLFFADFDTVPSNIKSVYPAIEKIRTIAEENNITTAQLAVAFIRDAKGVTSSVLGCETPEQIIDNVKNFSAPSLTDKVYDKIYELSDEIPENATKPWTWK